MGLGVANQTVETTPVELFNNSEDSEQSISPTTIEVHSPSSNTEIVTLTLADASSGRDRFPTAGVPLRPGQTKQFRIDDRGWKAGVVLSGVCDQNSAVVDCYGVAWTH